MASTVPGACDAADTQMIREKGYAKITPIKNDINRKAGILARKITGKRQGAAGRCAILRLNFRTGRHAFQNENVFVFGRYEKLEVGLSQTKWLCSWCDGRGCKRCGMSGTRFEDSVHQQIEAGFSHAGIAGSKFHGSGREDVDVRNIGEGRPFVIELQSPLKKAISLEKAQAMINKAGKVRVRSLVFVSQGMVEVVKNSRFDKNYHTTVALKPAPTATDIKKLEALSGATLAQQTPERVLRRRSDRTRMKKIFKVRAKISDGKIESDIFAECGTYIKELVSSDNGRTKPSFASAIGKAAVCEDLVMTGVEDNYMSCLLPPRIWAKAQLPR